MLNPERKVADVAFDSGFQSLPTFYRAFRKYTGESSTTYRLAHSEEDKLEAYPTIR